MPGTSLDECLQLLADGDRRRILEYLHRGPGEDATVEELSRYLQKADGVNRTPTRERRKIRIALVHVDLPKLAAHDVIDWDRQSGEIRYCPDEAAEAALERLLNTKLYTNS